MNTLSSGQFPIVDIICRHQHADYIHPVIILLQWWTIVNWKYVADRYAQFIQGSEERKKAAQLKKEQDEYIANKHKENAEVIQEALMDLQQEGTFNSVRRCMFIARAAELGKSMCKRTDHMYTYNYLNPGIISDVERVDDSADTKKADGAKEQQVKQEL